MKKNIVLRWCIPLILCGLYLSSPWTYAQQDNVYLPNIRDRRTLWKAEIHITTLADAWEKEKLVAIMTVVKTKLWILTDAKSQYILFELWRLIETYLPTAIQKAENNQNANQDSGTWFLVTQPLSDVTVTWDKITTGQAVVSEPQAEQWKASYYASSLEGNHTANGDIFDNNAFTAAHKTLPFNTRIKVTNSKNNLRVIVRINDRWPFTPGRILDLSQAAFKAINNDSLRAGVLDVSRELAE